MFQIFGNLDLSNIKMLSLYPEIDILVSKLRFRDFCQSFKGFGTENLVSEKSFGFVKFGLKKVSVLEKLVPGSVSENLVSEKKSRFGFGKFGIGKKSWYRSLSKFWYRHSVTISYSTTVIL